MSGNSSPDKIDSSSVPILTRRGLGAAAFMSAISLACGLPVSSSSNNSSTAAPAGTTAAGTTGVATTGSISGSQTPAGSEAASAPEAGKVSRQLAEAVKSHTYSYDGSKLSDKLLFEDDLKTALDLQTVTTAPIENGEIEITDQGYAQFDIVSNSRAMDSELTVTFLKPLIDQAVSLNIPLDKIGINVTNPITPDSGEYQSQVDFHILERGAYLTKIGSEFTEGKYQGQRTFVTLAELKTELDRIATSYTDRSADNFQLVMHITKLDSYLGDGDGDGVFNPDEYYNEKATVTVAVLP